MQVDDKEQKQSDIKRRITEEILMNCLCKFTNSNITDDAFSCRGSQGEFRNAVVYRAMITLQVPASITDADSIVNILSDWVESKPSVTVNGLALAVDPNCPAMLDSFDSSDCVIPNQANPPSSSSSQSIGIIIGAIVVTVIAILLLITVIVIIIMYYRHKSSYRYTKHIHSINHCYIQQSFIIIYVTVSAKTVLIGTFSNTRKLI